MSLFERVLITEEANDEKLMTSVAQHALGDGHSIRRNGNNYQILDKDKKPAGQIRKANPTKFQISTDNRNWNDIELDESKLMDESDEGDVYVPGYGRLTKNQVNAKIRSTVNRAKEFLDNNDYKNAYSILISNGVLKALFETVLGENEKDIDKE